RKRYRRLAIGPRATIIFENWDSMWWQIQEMLRVEKGGADQLADELAAYNPMVPNGRELTASLFFEVADPAARLQFLQQIGGVDRHVFLKIGDHHVPAMAEDDVDRTDESGKASAVHFLHFPLSDADVAAWRGGRVPVMVGIDHPNYGHIAVIGADVRAELARDFA
ncbi:MAG: DUF3501 family protein, partial [Sphingopyxis sp.]